MSRRTSGQSVGLIRGFSISFAANLVATGLSSLATLVVVANLPPHGWGLTASILGVGQLVGALLSFGSQVEHVRRYARLGPAAARISAYQDSAARILVASVFVLIALATSLAMPMVTAVLICAAGVFLSLGTSNFWISQKRFVAAGLLLLLEKVLGCAAVLLMVFARVLTPWSLPIVFGLAGLAAGVVGFIILGSRAGRMRFDVRLALRQQWSGSAYFGLSSLAPSLLLLDSAIVLALAGPYQAGYYSVGSKLVAPLSVATTSIVAVILPYMASNGKREFPQLNRRVGLPLMCLVGALLLALFFSADAWVPRLFGPEYAAGVWPVRFYLANVFVVIFTRILATILQAWNDERFVAWTIMAQVLLALSGIAAGAVLGGAILASASVLTTNLLLSVALWFRVKHLRGLESRQPFQPDPSGSLDERSRRGLPEP